MDSHLSDQSFLTSTPFFQYSAKLIDHVLQPLARSHPDYLHNSTELL